MNPRVRAVRKLWQERGSRAGGDRAYVVYAGVMILLIAVIPVCRALWITAGSGAGLALLGVVEPAIGIGVSASILTAVALMVGRMRGPALLPPTLTHVLMQSDIRRGDIIRSPLAVSAGAVTASTTAGAALLGTVLAVNGRLAPASAILFCLAGAAAGCLAVTAWLVGQLSPRVGVAGAFIMLIVGVAVLGLRGAATHDDITIAVHLSVVTGVLVVAFVAGAVFASSRLEALDLDGMMTQSRRWQSALSHAMLLDADGIAADYRAAPVWGRRLDAVRERIPPAFVVPISSAVSAVRRPVRSLAGLVALGASGALIERAIDSQLPHGTACVAAGILAYAGLSPFTGMMSFAAVAASDYPLYGLSDRRFLIAATLLPSFAGFAIASGGATLTAIVVSPGSIIVVGTVSGMLALSSVGAHLVRNLRGSAPLWLLTPAPSPLGDPMPLLRVAWSCDGLLLAALVGWAAASALTSIVPWCVTALLISALIVLRWRRRFA